MANSNSSSDDDYLFDGIPAEENCAEFDSAAAHVRTVVGKLNSEDLLYLYGRFKVGTEGPCETEKPGFFDFQGRKKWEVWKTVSFLSKDKARKEYVEKVKELDCGWNPDVKAQNTGSFGFRLSRPANSLEEAIPSEISSWIDLTRSDLNESEARKWANDKGMDFDVNVKDEDGLSALHWACDRGREDLVKLLVEKSADINCQAIDGQTPLHYAVSCGHVDVVKLLVGVGANKKSMDESGNIPKDLAEDEEIELIFSD